MVTVTVERFCDLACVVAGQGQSLVLLHGGTGSSSHWTRNIDAITDAYRVVAFDMPGFGRSPDVPGEIDAKAYIDWVARAAADATSGHPYRLVGFSFGAVIAAGVATRAREFVSALSLVGPGGFGSPAGRRLDLRTLSDESDEAMRRDAIRHNLLKMMIADPDCVDQATIDIQSANIRNTRFDSRRISLQNRLLQDIDRMDAPLQLIWGARDHLAYPSIEARAALCRTVRPSACVDIIPAAGHWVQYEQPALFNERLLAFAPESRTLRSTSA